MALSMESGRFVAAKIVKFVNAFMPSISVSNRLRTRSFSGEPAADVESSNSRAHLVDRSGLQNRRSFEMLFVTLFRPKQSPSCSAALVGCFISSYIQLALANVGAFVFHGVIINEKKKTVHIVKQNHIETDCEQLWLRALQLALGWRNE